jgi:hypothetical protein
MVLSIEERVFLVEYVFREGNGYTDLVQEQFSDKFPETPVPHRNEVRRLTEKFRETGSVLDARVHHFQHFYKCTATFQTHCIIVSSRPKSPKRYSSLKLSHWELVNMSILLLSYAIYLHRPSNIPYPDLDKNKNNRNVQYAIVPLSFSQVQNFFSNIHSSSHSSLRKTKFNTHTEQQKQLHFTRICTSHIVKHSLFNFIHF